MIEPEVKECNSMLPLKVILIGNYPNDGFRSMHLFAEMLKEGLEARGLTCVCVAPRPILGLIRGGATGVGKWLGYIDKFVIFPWRLRSIARQSKGGQVIFHVCDHSNGMYVRYLEDVPHLITCHDVLGIRSAFGLEPLNPRGRSGKIFQTWILRGLQKARHVACVSFHTKRQLSELGVDDERSSVVWNGPNYSYRPLAKDDAYRTATRIALNAGATMGANGFILHLSGAGWYKNRVGVVMAYAELVKLCPEAPLLFLAGRPLTSDVRELIDSLKIASLVVACPDQTTEDLNSLYSCARVLFFPSHAEGFGWPIVEAQACGCPVLTSDRAPMNEVGADAALYCDAPPADKKHLPSWAKAAAKQLQVVLEMNEVTHQKVVESGFENVKRFSADQMFDGYIKCYKKLSEKNKKEV